MAIDTKGIFCEAFNNIGASHISDFKVVLDAAKLIAKSRDPRVTAQALANAAGAWYAWLLVIFFEDLTSQVGKQQIVLKLPNVKTMPCVRLYEGSLHDLLEDFKKKLMVVAKVNLVTSNPDFAIINKKSEPSRIYDLSRLLKTTDLDSYDVLYKDFVGSCTLEDLVGFLGVKTSLRPDRRIQLLHEGSLMKAIHTHLKTRNWDITASSLKYYGLSLRLTNADIVGLKSVATHSIVSASLIPERAVDEMVQVCNKNDLGLFTSGYLT
jgi:hypothetical protein